MGGGRGGRREKGAGVAVSDGCRTRMRGGSRPAVLGDRSSGGGGAVRSLTDGRHQRWEAPRVALCACGGGCRLGTMRVQRCVSTDCLLVKTPRAGGQCPRGLVRGVRGMKVCTYCTVQRRAERYLRGGEEGGSPGMFFVVAQAGGATAATTKRAGYEARHGGRAVGRTRPPAASTQRAAGGVQGLAWGGWCPVVPSPPETNRVVASHTHAARGERRSSTSASYSRRGTGAGTRGRPPRPASLAFD